MKILSYEQAVKPQVDCCGLYVHLWKAISTTSHPQFPLDSLARAEASLQSRSINSENLALAVLWSGSTHVANWNECKVCVCRRGHVIWARREAFDVANGILPHNRRSPAVQEEFA